MDVQELFDESDDGPVLRVHVQTGAGRTQVSGVFGSSLKVRVAAPPEGGRANAAVIKLLAESLEVKDSALELIGGETSRSKRVLLRGAEPDLLVRALEGLLDDGNRFDAGGRRRP